MYLPRSFREDDLDSLFSLIERYNFGTLITRSSGGLVANHYPFLVERGSGPLGTLRAHLALANPQLQDLKAGAEVLVTFMGPHGYVSPAWYTEEKAVPTWNYAAVHAWGIPHLITEPEPLMALMAALVRQHEAPRAEPWVLVPEDLWTRGLLKNIVGFEIGISRIEGKLKLSQNRPESSQLGVIEALSGSTSHLDQELATLMVETRQRRKV